jgi:hypothetical protein
MKPSGRSSPGSAFGGWVGINGCGASPICTIPHITSNANIRAAFNLVRSANYYVSCATCTPAGDDTRTAPRHLQLRRGHRDHRDVTSRSDELPDFVRVHNV